MKFIWRAILIYAISWTLLFPLIVGPHFSYFFEYLKLAWTSPGEYPATINFYAIIVTIIAMVVGELWSNRRRF
jgi:hypothetical protein